MQGLLPTAFDFLGRKQEQRWAKQAANRQMDFQREMSNTAYQRAMADMRKAGINPIMVSKLGGASTPSGAMAKTPSMEGLGSKSMQSMLQTAQVEQAVATAKHQQANSRLAEQNANYFDKKSFGSAVLNARPMNILLTEIIERNPALLDTLSNLVQKGLTTGKDLASIMQSVLGGNWDEIFGGNEVIEKIKAPKPPTMVINPATGRPFKSTNDAGYQKYLKWHFRNQKFKGKQSYETKY